METSSTLIGLFILLLFMVPIVFVIIKSSSTEKKLKKSLQNLSSQNGVTINTSEVIGNTLIGLDENVHKLVFSYKNKLAEAFKTVDLSTINECRVATFKERKQPLSRVALELRSPSATDEIIFYEENDDSSPSTDAQICLNRASHWEKIIKQQM
ncbi:hypothetical protein [Marixanthomonas ophiurae]|uniref:Uncharacterized protein n=1 Tax=Marixanthomonas ophiurae TaxID=387659 RepID=A0A3E1QAF8_9FLAO|nr:hypothetical protein [Marixanthomonas ophiurae]RFN59129.1 hypothetical protein DZ858_03365 [Marixanthomonas ophiurae]